MAAGGAPRGEMSYCHKHPITAAVDYLSSEFCSVRVRMGLRFAAAGGAPRGGMSYNAKNPITVAVAYAGSEFFRGFWQQVARHVAK